MRTLVREMRGLPLWLLREYLVELGGQAVDETTVAGEAWRARLTRLEPFRLGSLEVGQVRLELEVEEDQADEFLARLDVKTLRAGG